MCIPFILAINLPAYSYTTGNPLYFWLAMSVSVASTLVGLVGFILIARKRAFQSPGIQWLPHEED
jgi:hypothetical protein